MKRYTQTIMMATLSAVLLTACGGTPSEKTKTGNVGDGYIEGAYVCHDSDHDWSCLDETYATTASDGSFTLSNYDPTKDLLVEVPVGAIDNGPFADGSTTPRTFTKPAFYVYPAGANSTNAPIFVGPLSTMVYSQMVSIPGLSLDDAIGIVASGIGSNPQDVLDNYLENNETNSTLHVFAELTSGAIMNTVNGLGSSAVPDFETVAHAMPAIAQTAATTDPQSGSYHPGNYQPGNSSGSGTSVSLNYHAVADVHADLLACRYYAFEEWDQSGSTSKEHKNLCLTTDADTGDKRLNITEHYYNGSAWQMDPMQSSAQSAYLARSYEALVDMDHVNDTPLGSDLSPWRFLPAIEQSHGGGNAVFATGPVQFKLLVSESDIAGLQGASLPQGPSVAPLVGSVTFGTGDKIYKATALTMNKIYGIKYEMDFISGIPISPDPSRYIVFDAGIPAGAAFSRKANTANITTLVGQIGTQFVVDYQDSSNYTVLTIDHSYNPASLNMLKISHIQNGSAGTVITSAFYQIETHNGTPFLVVPDYEGIGKGLFIGKVLSVDGSSFVYGQAGAPYVQIDLTEGGHQHGDLMDDIMLNPSAKERILNAQNITSRP